MLLLKFRGLPVQPKIGLERQLIALAAHGETSSWNSIFSGATVGPKTLSSLRVAIDCNSGLPEQSWGELKRDCAHGILISWHPNQKEIQWRDGAVKIAGSDPIRIASEMMNYVQDVHMDMSVFYRLDFIQGLYRSTQSKRSFDIEKRKFLHSKYGTHIPTIATACRKARGEFDIYQFEDLWRDFIDKWIIPGSMSVPTKDATMIEAHDIEHRIEEQLSAFHKLRGQLSGKGIALMIERFYDSLRTQKTARSVLDSSRNHQNTKGIWNQDSNFVSFPEVGMAPKAYCLFLIVRFRELFRSGTLCAAHIFEYGCR